MPFLQIESEEVQIRRPMLRPWEYLKTPKKFMTPSRIHVRGPLIEQCILIRVVKPIIILNCLLVNKALKALLLIKLTWINPQPLQ